MRRKKKKARMKMSGFNKTNDLVGSEISNTDFKIKIRGDVYDKIMYWVRSRKVEVSGYGTAEYDAETNTFLIVAASILDVGSAAETTIDPELANRYSFDNREGGAGRWHWHSHPNMSAYFSPTDKSLIRGLGQASGWIIATVFNEKSECHSGFYQLVDVMGKPHEIFLEKLPTSIERSYSDEVIQSWEDETNDVETFIRQKRPPVYVPPWQDWRGNNGYGQTTMDYDEKKIPTIGGQSYCNGLKIDEYDDDGWMFATKINKNIYNPLRDKGLFKDYSANDAMAVVWNEIVALESDEFAFLYKDDVVFRSYVDKNFEESERREMMK